MCVSVVSVILEGLGHLAHIMGGKNEYKKLLVHRTR
jgi:hypothetical protein